MAKKASLSSLREFTDLKDQLRTARELQADDSLTSEQSGKVQEQLGQIVGKMRGMLPQVAQELRILSGRLIIDPTSLMDLHEGRMDLNGAIKGKKVEFVFNIADKKWEQAAEQLSLLTELAELDPSLAKELTAASLTHHLIEALLKQPAANDPAKPSLAETLRPQSEKPSEAAKVTGHAMALYEKQAGHQALVAYLAGKDVLEGDAAHALVELGAKDRELAQSVLRQLPQERVTGMTVGLLTIDRVGVLTLTSPELAAQLVERQFRNDRHPERGFTDRNNMTASYLLDQIIQEHEQAHVILSLLCQNLFERIASQKSPRDVGADREATSAARKRLRDYWNQHAAAIGDAGKEYRRAKKDVRAKAAAEGEEEQQKVAIPEVDLGRDVDLNAI